MLVKKYATDLESIKITIICAQINLKTIEQHVLDTIAGKQLS